VPTLIELGYKGFDAVQWYGVVGPAGMPPAVVMHLNETLGQVLKAPDLRERLAVEAVEPQAMSPGQFGQYITADIARWSRLARERDIRLEG
jgi:tripartite-type tricarboxylate transporter receptor subunit TctC